MSASAANEASEFESALRRKTVDQIEQEYRDGYLEQGDKNYMLREKAKVTLSDLIESKGSLGAVWDKTLEHAAEGWENIVEAAQQDPESGAGNQLYHSLRAMWGQIQILGAAQTAVGEVAGNRVEKFALSKGAPPGLAWAIGAAVDFGVQIVPIAAGTRLAAAAGRKVVGTDASAIGKMLGSKGEQFSKESLEEIKMLRTFSEGLAKEGLKDTNELMAKFAEKAFKQDIAAGLRVVKEAEAVAPEVAQVAIPRSAAESFAESVNKHLAANVPNESIKAELPKLMKKFGISWPDLKSMRAATSGRQVMGTREFHAHLKALEEHGAELSSLAKKAIGSTATDADRAAFMRYATGLFTNSTDRMVVNKAFTDLLMHWDPARVASGDIIGAMKTFATDMANLTPKQSAKNLFTNQQGFAMMDVPWFSIGREHYANLLLPLSWPAATLGNSIATGTAIAERLVGSGFREAFYMTKGMTLAIGDAIKAGWFAGPGSFGSVSASAGRNVIGNFGSGNVLARGYGRVVNFQRDALIANDTMFKLIIMRGSLYADAIKEAKQIGASNVGAYVRNFVANPTAESIVRAVKLSEKGTFSNDLGRIGKALTTAMQGSGGGAGTLYFTFVKSAINLGKFGFDRTPILQLMNRHLWQDIAAGGQRASDAMARLTLGSFAGMFYYEMAKEGFITGSGPADPALRSAWLLTHDPYSFGVPGAWFSYQNFQPLMQILGFTTDVAQIMDQLDDATAGEASYAIAHAFMHNFANQTAWRQLSQLNDILVGIMRSEKFSRQDVMAAFGPALAVGTGGPIGMRTARVLDPVARETRTLYDMWAARVTGYSTTLPPFRDGLGRPVLPPQTAGTPWFGYFTPLAPRLNNQDTDPVAKEAWRLKIHLPRFGDSIGAGELPSDFDITKAFPGDPIPVGLTPKQRDRWKQIYNNIIEGSGTKENPGIKKFIMESDAYTTDPETESPTTWAMQRSMFQGFVNKAKQEAANALMVEEPELFRKMTINTYQSVLPKRPPETHEGLAQQGANTISTFEEMAPEEQENLLKYGVLEADKPFKKPPISFLGSEVVGEREYTPAPMELRVNPQTGEVTK